eukprot:CAMPEP_0196999770 /NCGR_PEP_ID=MMETSP1380-20130617/4878_1 /TAXON_ID=5936 /ORGANISM="Euplotes crassus, Strain CT5" /LENGTH=264 /DNA_ID=CAMNT_0042416811 /DNA_START=14 /DNA_END=808 /DNA_ORIENTATION=+
MENRLNKKPAFLDLDTNDKDILAAGMSRKIVARTKFEKYRRIKPQTLAKMMKDYNEEDDDRLYEDSYGGIMLKQHYNLFEEERKEDAKSGYEQESVYSNKTTESVASIFQANADFYETMEGKKNNTSKFEASSVAPTEELMETTSSMLLLDLRDVEDYVMAHIKGAISFPSPNIARDKFTKNIWQYKNKEDKIIIIYHKDEKCVIEAAELLVEKHFENIYIMNNGFEEFSQENPLLIEGKNAHLSNNVHTSTFSYKKPVKPLTE